MLLFSPRAEPACRSAGLVSAGLQLEGKKEKAKKTFPSAFFSLFLFYFIFLYSSLICIPSCLFPSWGRAAAGILCILRAASPGASSHLLPDPAVLEGRGLREGCWAPTGGHWGSLGSRLYKAVGEGSVTRLGSPGKMFARLENRDQNKLAGQLKGPRSGVGKGFAN